MRAPPETGAGDRSTGQTIQYGKYRLLHRLGKGGMAEVWLAELVGLIGTAGPSRLLVIKRILPHLAEDPHFLALFLAEARLSARLNHPNIVAVTELGEHQGEYFLAMEYIDGHDLLSVVRTALNEGVSTPALAAYVVREVACALAYAHALTDDKGRPLGVIHRDVSPSNVMVSYEGAVKLLDFGVAKARDDSSMAVELSVAGALKGKFAYMAPEQLTGTPIDHRVDIFAAGVVMWEVLTGRRLFKGASERETLELVREAAVPPPSGVVRGVPPALDAIVMRATARERAARYATADQLGQELDEVVRALGWGPEQMAELMRRLFPEPRKSLAPSPAGDWDTNSSLLLAAFDETPLWTGDLSGPVLVIPEPPAEAHASESAALRPTDPALRVLVVPAELSLAVSASPAGAAARMDPTPLALLLEDPKSDEEVVPASAAPASTATVNMATARTDPAVPVQPLLGEAAEAPVRTDGEASAIAPGSERVRPSRRGAHLWWGVGIGTIVGLIGVVMVLFLLLG